MIAVEITLDHEGGLRRLSAKGHAQLKRRWFASKERFNCVCSALSTLEYCFYQAIGILKDVKLELEKKPGHFDLRIIDVPPSSLVELRAHTKMFLLGMKLLEKEHGDIVKLQLEKLNKQT